MVGISLASVHSPSADPKFSWGIIFALVSTMNLALLNVFSKKLLTTSFTAISLLHLITKISLMIFVPFYIMISIFYKREVIFLEFSFSLILPLILLLDGFLSFSQNILAFSLLSMCSPLTYSIANCSKRVAIISLSFLFFSIQNITFVSMTGIFISLFGILCYNLAKHQEKNHRAKPTLISLDTNDVIKINNTSGSYSSNNTYAPNDYSYKSSMSRDYSFGSFYNV